MQDILPWIKQSFTLEQYDYKVVKQYLNDNPAMHYRKGDIIKFNDGFFHIQHSDWRGWFVTKKDRKRFWKRNPVVAKYARNQLAIVVGRYRLVKFKYRTFADYGVVSMLLTGPKVGHIRHYWTGRPFNIISPFELPLTSNVLRKRMMPEILDMLDASHEDTNEGRNLLVSRLYYKLKGV